MIRRQPTPLRRLPLVISIIAACFVAGCTLGFKEWPEPVAAEDSFTIVSVDSFREGDCLTVVLVLDGAVNNLSGALLQLEPYGDGMGCPTCPFMPRQSVEFGLESPGFTRQVDTVRIEYCGLASELDYRWRVRLNNHHPTIPSVLTDVFRPEEF